MAKNKPYLDRVHQALSDNLDGFNLSPQEFTQKMLDPAYVARAHQALSENLDGFTKPLVDFHKAIVNPAMQRDNTKYVPNQKPLSQQEFDNVQESKYFNPEIKEDYTSGNSAIDFVYKHPSLMNAPIVGDYIKNQAYNVARNSKGLGVVDTDPQKVASGSENLRYDGKDGRANLVDQYFGKGVQLPSSRYKPTSDYLTFLPSYSVKGDLESRIPKEGLDFSPYYESLNGGVVKDFSKPFKPLYKTFATAYENPITEELVKAGLGGHKAGIAFDQERNLPYVSISDAWDFEPGQYSKKYADSPSEQQRAYIQASLMQRVGHPFKVYDRFYFNPKTRMYIPDSEVPNPKSSGR